MGVGITRGLQHNENSTMAKRVLQRTPSPWFAPPVPSWQREPGTNLVTIFTAPTPDPGLSNPRTAGERSKSKKSKK